MLIRNATLTDVPAINEIYNTAVAWGCTADIFPISMNDRTKWFFVHV